MYKYVMLMVVSVNSLVAMHICPPMEQPENSSPAQDPVAHTYDRLFKTYQQKYNDDHKKFRQTEPLGGYTGKKVIKAYQQELAQTLPEMQEEYTYNGDRIQTLFENLKGSLRRKWSAASLMVPYPDLTYQDVTYLNGRIYDATVQAQQAVFRVAMSNYARLFLHSALCEEQLLCYNFAIQDARKAQPYVVTSALLPGMLKDTINPWLSKPEECDQFIDAYNKLLVVASYTKAIMSAYMQPGMSDMASEVKDGLVQRFNDLRDADQLALEWDVVQTCKVYCKLHQHPHSFPSGVKFVHVAKFCPRTSHT